MKWLLLAASVLTLGISSAEAADLEVHINPDGASEFDIKYLITVSIPYGDGQVADILRGDSWTVSASAPAGSADAQAIADQLNEKIAADGSRARVANLEVDYDAEMIGRPDGATIYYRIVITGDITDHLIRAGDGPNPALIDIGWRGMMIRDPVIVDGVEINYPLSAIESESPELASLIAGSPAEDLLRTGLIGADRIRDTPLDHWYFLFDPTGVISNAKEFGIDEDMAGFVVSQFSMGEPIWEPEEHREAAFAADTEHVIRTSRPADFGYLAVIGFARPSSPEGVDTLRVLPAPPEYARPAAGGFPAAIAYVAAGIAAAGAAFLAYVWHLRRARGDDMQPPAGDAACGCAASDGECDCQLQGSCLCGAGCGCGAQICRDHAGSF